MADLSTSGVVREILTTDPDMPTDDVIHRAKRKGLRVPDEKIRHSVHNQRNTIRAKLVGNGQPAPSVVQATAEPVPLPTTGAASTAETSTADLRSVFANITLVNKIVSLCGVENARQVAKVVEV